MRLASDAYLLHREEGLCNQSVDSFHVRRAVSVRKRKRLGAELAVAATALIRDTSTHWW